MEQRMIQVENVSKRYRLGQIGGTTLQEELQRFNARLLHREDPTRKLSAKQYAAGDSFLALDGVSFAVKKGERLGVIGHNGAGKTTLLKLISRITAPTGGTIGINGRVSSMLEVGTGFHPELTGRENIYLYGAILGMTRREIDRKLEAIIDFSECREFIDTPVKRYSSGMYVKLAFSVAAHLDSEIIIMDEVLAVGDLAFQRKCLQKMSEISENESRTILYVSHNMSTIRQLCDRCIVLEHGKLVYDGETERAIEIYLGSAAKRLPLDHDLRDAPRPATMKDRQMRLTSLCFEGAGSAVFERTEPIRFTVAFTAFRDFERLYLCLPLCSSKGESVGMSQSLMGIQPCVAGKSYVYRLAFDASNLVPGEYCFVPELYSDNGVSKYFKLDRPERTIRFRLEEEHQQGMDWNERVFGRVRLAPLTVLSGGEVRGNDGSESD